MHKLDFNGLRRIILEELQIGSQHALALATANKPPRPDLRDDLRGSHEWQLIKNLIDSCKAYMTAGNSEGAAGHLRAAAHAYCMHYGEEGQGAEDIFDDGHLADKVLHIVRNIGDVMIRRKDVLPRLVQVLEKASADINLVGPYHVHPSSYIAEGRATDPLKLKIIKFFFEHITTDSNMTALGSSMVKLPDSKPLPNGKIPRIPAFTVTLNGVPPYGEYVRMTGDDGSKTGGKPIIYEYSYNDIPNRVKFEIVPNISSGFAGVDQKGVFTFFKKDWSIDLEKARAGTLQAEDIVDGMPRAEESKKFILDAMKQPDMFAHEYNHIINALRSGGVYYPAKGGNKQFEPDSAEYASSTEELDSYFTEGSYRLDRVLDMPLKDIAKKWDMDYVYYLAIRDRKRFINAFIYVMMEHRHGDVWAKADEAAKRRFRKRVYGLYDDYLGSKKTGLRQMVKYLAGTKLKPPREMRRTYDT